MTKADIVERIQIDVGLSKKESTALLESVFSIMKKTLESGKNLKISGNHSIGIVFDLLFSMGISIPGRTF